MIIRICLPLQKTAGTPQELCYLCVKSMYLTNIIMLRKGIIIAGAMGMLLVGGTLQAQNAATENTKTAPPRGQYVDTNKDGVCDNRSAANNQRRNRQFKDENGDGVCDQYAIRNGKNNAFGKGRKDGKRQGRGNGQCRRGNGQGPNAQ